MLSVFKDNRFFLIPFAAFIILGMVFLTCHTRAETHLIINSYHNSFLDKISPYITALGDGWTAIIVTILLVFTKLRYALLSGLAFFVASFFTQFFRRTIFHGWPRPVKYFEGIHELHFVPGVTPYSINTFPSGHTATAFAMFFCLSILVKNNFLKLLFFILALLVALSRVYLSQHFFADVYGSSLIGVFSALTAYFIVLLIKKNWPEQSLQTIFKRS